MKCWRTASSGFPATSRHSCAGRSKADPPLWCRVSDAAGNGVAGAASGSALGLGAALGLLSVFFPVLFAIPAFLRCIRPPSAGRAMRFESFAPGVPEPSLSRRMPRIVSRRAAEPVRSGLRIQAHAQNGT